jgi:hypothetical protein
MDRRTFLGRFGMGVGAVILAPKIIASSIIKPDDKIILPNQQESRMWRNNSLSIRIINNNPVPTEVMLLGVNQNIEGNFIPEGIKIFINGYTAEQLNSLIMAQPVRITGLRIKVKSIDQLTNPMNIYRTGKNGCFSRMMFQPVNYISALSDDITMIDCPFELLLTPEVYLMNEINANEQVDYCFTLGGINSTLRSS